MAGSFEVVDVEAKHGNISMSAFATGIKNLTPPYTPSEDEGLVPPKGVPNSPTALTIGQAEDLYTPTSLEPPDDGDPIVIVGIGE